MNDNTSSLRFHLQSPRHAKNVAKNFKGFLESLGQPMKLSGCQALVAELFGYKDWHDLEQSIHAGRAVGPVDAQLSPEDLALRRAMHLKVLSKFGVAGQGAVLLLEKCAPTAGDPVFARELLWTTSAIAVLECAETTFMPAMRIYEGRRDRSQLDVLGLIDSVRPSQNKDAAKLTLPGFSAFRAYDGETLFVHPVAEGGTLEEVKEAVESEWRSRKLAELELKSMGRHKEKLRDEDGRGSGWFVGKNNRYEVEEVEEIADGLYHLHADSAKSYVLAFPEWLRSLPDVFRPATIDDAEPQMFYLDSAGQMFPLCFPEVYTRSEVETAVAVAQVEFPDAYKAFVLGEDADDLTMARGSRGFSTIGREYHVIDELEDTPEGERLVLAALTGLWGQSLDESELDKLYVFRIGADQLESYTSDMCRIDETIHRLEGEYHLTLTEWQELPRRRPT